MADSNNNKSVDDGSAVGMNGVQINGGNFTTVGGGSFNNAVSTHHHHYPQIRKAAVSSAHANGLTSPMPHRNKDHIPTLQSEIIPTMKELPIITNGNLRKWKYYYYILD